MSMPALALAVLLAAPAVALAAPPTPPDAPAAAARPFASLAELDQAIAAVEGGAPVDALWDRVRAAGALPLVFGETAVFFYRDADAAGVQWRGDFNGWSASEEDAGKRVGGSDVFVMRRTFLPGARLDYKLVVTSERWLVDPLNPHQQVGGFGPNSELRLPGWTPSAYAAPRPGGPHGVLGAPELVDSAALGYAVAIRVYTPAGGGEGRLPILYVTDGSDYWRDDMGGLVTTLDNLIADRRIPPLVAVFVDAWDPDHKANRRDRELVPERHDDVAPPTEACPFCDFLVKELAPKVEPRLRVDAARRGVLGTSLGGLFAAYVGLRYPDHFRLLAIQSPANADRPWVAGGFASAKRLPARVALCAGDYEQWVLGGARALRHALTARKVAVLHLEAPEGHSWGQWRAQIAPMLEFLYRR